MMNRLSAILSRTYFIPSWWNAYTISLEDIAARHARATRAEGTISAPSDKISLPTPQVGHRERNSPWRDQFGIDSFSQDTHDVPMLDNSTRLPVIAQPTSNGEPIWVLPRTKESYSRLLSQVAFDLHSRLGMSAGDAMLVSANALTSIGIHIQSMMQDAG